MEREASWVVGDSQREQLIILGRACVHGSYVQASIVKGAALKVLNKKMKEVEAPEDILHGGGRGGKERVSVQGRFPPTQVSVTNGTGGTESREGLLSGSWILASTLGYFRPEAVP